MDIKKILVPLDSSIYTEGTTETACRVAKTHGAEIAGIAVLDSPEIRASVIPAIGPYYPMMIDAVHSKLQHAEQILEESIERFATTCGELGVTHIETEYEGIPAQKLLESSIFFDLVVLGLETAFHFETRGGRGDTLDKMLDNTATPILAVPPTGMPDPERALVAFDGSFGASRALRDFMILAEPYDPEITVVTADLKPAKSEFLLGNAAELLRSHGFTKIESVSSESPVEDAVTDAMIDAADVVVAGIHSRHRIKDMFVGSFTSKLIKRGDTALFLSH
jgi:nucleotide-binding universal stress UspA family protein